jgi:3-isopropylmalate/(R)-2-methylmalate dehydratase small subunit
MSGRVWTFGDNIDTDTLAPGLYMKAPIEELARHCLEAVDPCFAAEARPGDIVVAGRNFGMGSSREQAVMALKHLGIAAVLARSFAGLFRRNAINLGLPVLVCQEAASIAPGTRLSLDLESGRATDPDSGHIYAFDPLPGHLTAIIADGGLLPHLEKRLRQMRAGMQP